jgi:shikimate dehydrogenase
MTPNINTSPLPEDILLPSHAVIYDLVYNPRETKLVREARSQGLRATTGLGMLVEQAALGFELWTENKLPSEIFRNAVK